MGRFCYQGVIYTSGYNCDFLFYVRCYHVCKFCFFYLVYVHFDILSISSEGEVNIGKAWE